MFCLFSLAQSQGPAAWLPVVLLLVIGLVFAIGTLTLSVIVGPSRTGPAKALTYESGMVPVGDARRRFNVRFYIVAMIFLVFDVEIIFFYPWATVFSDTVAGQSPAGAVSGTVLLLEMLVFTGILLVAYLYAWGKGVFKWE